MKPKPALGVIGGSGLYSMDGLANVEELDLETPFGSPSSSIIRGELEGKQIVFIARHGRDHQFSPSDVNYRANIYAFKMLGVQQVLSVSAAGSLREDYAPGDIVVPSQLFDFTKNRERTFFGQGLVAHISIADPFCEALSSLVAESVKAVGGNVHLGGTFITVEGPRFSTRAESNTYRGWGMSIIGMTTSPEAFLAREAEMSYAVMAHVTDYDVWHISEEAVTVEMVVRILAANTALVQNAITHLTNNLEDDPHCDCQHALRDALITDPKEIPTETKERLALLVHKYLS
jgi:5'-methylthioadenosine phosphorylase